MFLTYLGFCTFFFATMWNANLVGKLSNIAVQWRELRETAPRKPAEREHEDGERGDEQA